MLADRQAGGGMLKSEVDTGEVAAVVRAWTGVPVSRLMEGEAVKLIQMEDVIRRRVVGQDEAVSRLIGAPPGYAGFYEGGQLTEAVHRRPYAVVLPSRRAGRRHRHRP